MKFAALVSGGKDSIYSIHQCVFNGHELLCCIHLGAPSSVEEESFMYQTAGSNVIPILVEECLCVPLILQRRTRKSTDTSMVYANADTGDDEVEDLYEAIKKAVDQFPEIQAIASGAILSNYQRVRVEHVCSRLGLTSLSYLWRLAPQHVLLERMLEDGIEAVLVKTACPPGLVPSKHLNKTLQSLYYSGLFEQLHERYHFHYCGEGGEYESLVVDCPLFKKRLVLDKVEIDETDDGVGELIIKAFHTEDKEIVTVATFKAPAQQSDDQRYSKAAVKRVIRSVHCLPHVQRLPSGLLHVSEVISPFQAQVSKDESEADLAVKEALLIFDILKQTLKAFGCSYLDVIIVHVYLSEISHFSNINQHYRDVFGIHLPPSRCTVAIGRNVLPGGRRIMLDCMVQIGSGDFMREKADANAYAKGAVQTKTSELRQVLHVQSISSWAPVCVGPYSQVNTIRSSLHFVAGQIGLNPPTMTLRKGLHAQLKQAWKNTARILDSLEGASLDNLLSCLIYVSAQNDDDMTAVADISRDMIARNAGVLPGIIDASASRNQLFGGYEDEDTWREMTKNDPKKRFRIPILVVEIEELPLGALVEVETICVTQKACSCLELQYSCIENESPVNPPDYTLSDLGWNTGYDFPCESYLDRQSIRFSTTRVSVGSRCTAMSTVAAWISDWVDPDNLLSIMLDKTIISLESASLSLRHVLNVRFYYVTTCLNGEVSDDGMRWRSSLATMLALKAALDNAINGTVRLPATSVIPVRGMHFAREEMHGDGPSIALQVMAIDPVHMETEIWIHHGRECN